MCLDGINDIFLLSDSSLDGIFHSSRTNSNGVFSVAAYGTNFLSPSLSAFLFSFPRSTLGPLTAELKEQMASAQNAHTQPSGVCKDQRETTQKGI